ncbi:membrane assembly protein AsmA [Frateuria sp. Soil773]|uniref:AsmA family protein n=1 Tax=Frateuria sp. Soil773 TaxID=1736407 RepID=UPI0006FA375D|nr:AsmA family protein [Frateuria sp. Soil773]KRE90990.1 membrane assembly protein AsmA [Frateuria sp. Soil773]
MSRRWHLLLWTLAGLLLVGLLVAVVTVYVLLQPERFTAMLQRQARNAGLELNLASPASPTLFPRPALELQGLTLNAEGAGMPILLAARGRLALPWRTLFGGPTVISRLEIDAPRVDLDALQAWLSGLPSRPDSVPSIPRIDAGVSITRGSLVRGNQLLLGELSLKAGSLVPGQPFPLDVAAKDAAGTPMRLELSATPALLGNTLQLNDVALHLSYGPSLSLQLGGSAHWHGAADASASLRGKLDEAKVGPYDVALELTPANQRDPLLLALKLDGPSNHADLRLPPLALAHWWSQLASTQEPRLSVPPGSGHLEAAKIEASGIVIEGLSLQAGADVPAPSSSSAPATSAKPAVKQPKKS